MDGDLWYVAIDGRTAGPFPVEEVRRLARQGVLRPDCAVARVGDQDWVEVARVQRGLSLEFPAAVHGAPPAATIGTLGAGMGGPAGLQPSSGAPVAPAVYWKRAAALALDWVVLNLVASPVVALTGWRVEVDLQAGTVDADWRAVVLTLVVQFAYFAGFHATARAQTPGKLLLRIRVADAAGGGPIGPARACARSAVVMLLLYPCFLGAVLDHLWPLWDERRQTLHDKAARSVVVDAPPRPAPERV